MFELELAERQRVRQLCAGLEPHLIVEALLEGTSPGRVFVDHIQAPRTALLCSAEGTFLVGDAANEAFVNAVHHYARETILTPGGEDELVLYFAHDAWERQIPTILRPRQPIVRQRSYFELTASYGFPPGPPPGFEIRALDAAWFDDHRLRNVDGVLGWVRGNWGGREAFLRWGFGSCVLDGATVVSYSLADCVSGRRCEVGIMTDAAWRRRGLGAAAVAATIAQAVERGQTRIGWHCWSDNLASRRLAQQADFALVAEYTVQYCLANEEQHARALGTRGH